jgi:hypothetical protein
MDFSFFERPYLRPQDGASLWEGDEPKRGESTDSEYFFPDRPGGR